MLKLYETAFGSHSEQVGSCHVDITLVYKRMKDREQTMISHQKAHSVFSSLEKYSGTDFLADLALKLAKMQVKRADYNGAILNLS